MNADSKILVGITGGIASGKSTVSRFWAAYAKLPLIDIDSICGRLLEKNNPGWQAVQKEFGRVFFMPDDHLDRRRLRSAIFTDENFRHKINSLIHPLAMESMQEKAAGTESSLILVDVPLLYEAKWHDQFRHCVVVFAEPAISCRRLMERDTISFDEAMRTIRSQIQVVGKAMLADHVINNSGCRITMMLEVIHLARLLAPESKNR